MPRKRVVDPNELQAGVDVRFKKRQGRPKKEEADDPRPVMVVGTVIEPAKKIKGSNSGADKYTLYARALVANNGDIIEALAAAYGITRAEAEKDAIKLHEDVRSYSRSGISLQEMLEKHDLTREARLAILRDALFSPQPAVRLKAVEMIDEVDMTAKAARIGNTWDDIVRIAKDRAQRKKRAS
jgi:hypothetical protein